VLEVEMVERKAQPALVQMAHHQVVAVVVAMDFGLIMAALAERGMLQFATQTPSMLRQRQRVHQQ
jgi:hypothetical protein